MTKPTKTLSPLSTSIIAAVLAATDKVDSKAIAATLNVKPASVSGALAALKKNEMVSINEKGIIKVLRAGKSVTGALKREPKAGTKIAAAKSLFMSMPGASRKDVLAKMTADLGLSAACAATYYATAKKSLPASDPVAAAIAATDSENEAAA
jgi:DNA-binding transcriptional ArsR family regulator